MALNLAGDDRLGLADPCEELIDAVVERGLTDELVQRRVRAARRAVAGNDVQERDRPLARAGERHAELRRELRVATAADGHEDATGPGCRPLHDRQIARRVAEDLLHRAAEVIPAGPAPAQQQDVGVLVADGLDHRGPPLSRDGDDRADHERSGEGEQLASPRARLRLRRREGVALRHLDDRGEDDVVRPREGRRDVDEPAVARGFGDDDEALHPHLSVDSR